MEPRCVAGQVYRPGAGVEEGWILHDGATVLDSGEGKPPTAPAATGIVVPTPVNAHTHLGDRVARGVDISGLSLADVVKPPDGLKHRLLAKTSPDALVNGMREALSEMAFAGARLAIDFREGGAEGVALLREAVQGEPASAMALGRAPSWSDEEIAQVLDVADGIGFPGLDDAPPDAAARAAGACQRAGKPFALHFSEARRDDVDRALALKPAFLVHGVHATPEDLDAIAAARVPIVSCPRSNALFGGRADIAGMLDRGIRVALGSDNAMFHPLDVLLDARHLFDDWPGLAREDVLDMLIVGGRAAAGESPRTSWLRKGDPADFVVYALHGEPLVDLLGDRPPRLLHAPWLPTETAS